MTTTSKTLANTILEVSFTRRQPIDHMKLQKLMFFAHGYHLAMVGAPLTSEGFEAWPYGPVCRPVYAEFRRFGADPINAYALEYADGAEPKPYVVNKSNTRAYEVIHAVWERFAPFSAIQLSDMTHQPDTPWRRVMSSGRLVIPDDEIRAYFSAKISQGLAY